MVRATVLAVASIIGPLSNLPAAATAPSREYAPISYFLAPNGNDNNGDGSIGNPWATIGRAQQALGALASMDSDAYVNLRAGEYFLPQPVEFTPADSGKNGYTIHYASYDAEPATLHGGVAVTGWTQVDMANNIWAAALPASALDTRQVYISGDRMNATNTGAGLPGTVAITSYWYTTTDALSWAFLAQQNPADIEFLYTGVGSTWTEARCRVATVEVLAGGGANLTMQQPCFDIARNRFYGQGVSTPASISNVYALLSSATPGQYYFNSAERTIYYVPRSIDDMATAVVIVPTTEVLLRLTGDRDAQPTIQPVSYLSFERLTFSYAGWLEPNNGIGYVDMQSGFRIYPNSTADDSTWVQVPGNVAMHTVSHVSIINCTFAHLGATALVVDSGSQNVLISNNTFQDLSCGGVYVGNDNDANVTDVTRQDAHYVVSNNLFTNIPVEYRDCAALCGGYIENITISHNTIINNSNTGISLGWGWSRDEATNAANNLIDSNYVYGSNWLLEDGGSIYVLGPQVRSYGASAVLCAWVRACVALTGTEA